MKQRACAWFLAGLLSCSLMAMEDEYHRPYFKDEVLKVMQVQLKAYERCLATKLGESACEGFLMPWFGSFGLGAYLGSKDAHGDLREKLGQAFSGGVVSTLCLSPIAIVLSLPLAFISMSYTTVRYLIDGIKTQHHEAEFEREMAKHLFQWIDVVKRGRLAIRRELKAMESAAHASNKAFSLSHAASELLVEKTFEKYFGSISWNQSSLAAILSHLDQAQDTWEHLFHTVSFRMKIPELTDQQWATLEQRLQLHVSDNDFAAISHEDIREYLICAIYFFTIANPNYVKMLEHYAV